MKRYLNRLGILVCITALIFIGLTGLVGAKGKDRRHHIHKHYPRSFQRIATFPVFLNTDVDLETVAEIVAATKNGQLLVYTDSQTRNIGFVDIRDPHDPMADGVVAVGGEPTSVAVLDRYKDKFALVAVNTSASFTNPSGVLEVVDIATRQIIRSIDLGGQPDSIAVSPDGRYAAIAIENERDEDAGNGRPPQAPPGFVVIVDLIGSPASWQTRAVDLVEIPEPDRFPEDPEPEFVDINADNIAAVTLQENNHVALIDLEDGKVIEDWPVGSVNLKKIDIVENDLIELKDEQPDRRREPDAVAWTAGGKLATADEGDLDGGSRGFTLFNQKGDVLFSAGNALEHLVVRLGHYPENRSENKGNEPEGIEFGRYGKDDLLFVGSERSSVVAVYRLLKRRSKPELLQVLPGGVGPEGLLALPQRNLFVTASEEDARDDGIRGTITIYKFMPGEPTYPTVKSAYRKNDLPIPWGALSALAADPYDPHKAFTAYDSFYRQSRIFELDVSQFPAVITDEIVLTLEGDGDDAYGDDEAGDADEDDGEDHREGKKQTVDLDVEGLAVSEKGGFWVVSEGAGSVDDEQRPVESLNLLYRVAKDGTILKEIQLPDSVNELQRRFGFEGVAEDGRYVYVAFQREWVGDPAGLVRIGRYDTRKEAWAFFYYPLDDPQSPNGGWVGLSEIVALGRKHFAVIERDNQAGTDARIKKIYRFSVAGKKPRPQGDTFPLLKKRFVRDLIPDLQADNGPVLEKVEGLMPTGYGDAFIVTDNDGVDDSSGETQLIYLGPIFSR